MQKKTIARKNNTGRIPWKKQDENLGNPLIELSGSLDCGKIPLGQALAYRLGGQFYNFPIFNAPSSITGTGLLMALTTSVEALEANPEWWTHLYLANLWENHKLIKEALTYGPVVVCNWTVGARVYAQASCRMPKNQSKELVKGLTDPDIPIILQGDVYEHDANVPVKFTKKFQLNFQRELTDINWIKKIYLSYPDDVNRTLRLNRHLDAVVSYIRAVRPDIKDNNFKYSKGLFNIDS
jgi:hypothetical protein